MYGIVSTTDGTLGGTTLILYFTGTDGVQKEIHRLPMQALYVVSQLTENKVWMIKIIRGFTDLSLREAKEFADFYFTVKSLSKVI